MINSSKQKKSDAEELKKQCAEFGKISGRLYERASAFLVKKGELLVQKGEATDSAYYVASGKLYVRADFQNGGIYQFAYKRKGEIVSDIEVLSGTYLNVATLCAAEDTLVLQIPLKLFEEELRANNDFLYYVAAHMAENFYGSSYDRGSNVLKSGLDKVVLYLIRSYEMDEDEGRSVRIEKTRAMIASEIGISEKTLNRAISRIEAEFGFLTLVRGKITISEEQFTGLLRYAEDAELY